MIYVTFFLNHYIIIELIIITINSIFSYIIKYLSNLIRLLVIIRLLLSIINIIIIK